MSRQYSDEFVKASLLAGYLATAIDNHFGNQDCSERLHLIGMDIDFACVEQMKADAIARGCPVELLTLSPEEERGIFNPVIMAVGRKMQAARDKQTEGRLSREVN